MRPLATSIFGFAGFIAGMLLWAQFTRWLALLYVLGSKEGGDFLGPPKRRLLWAVPFVSMIHPAPWLLGAALLLAFRTLRGDAGDARSWFFGGLVLALLFMILVALAALARWRRLQLAQANRTTSNGVDK